ncbi:cullin-9-like isoform X2 [Prinia subflava]|uniref:cullin-9-like isoform X2 n=1 Tax=Prinia subflava TaxID=208062 RepID=UPI002FE3788A
MVNEEHSGALLLQLGPGLRARPEELLRQRRGPGGRPEFLVRWSVLGPERRAAGGASCAEGEAESISLWMSAEEVGAACPALPAPRAPGRQREAPGAGVPPDRAWRLEMEADVRGLVRRARRQLAEAGPPEGSVLSTLRVLGAYAGIGSLAGAFAEPGALELLTASLRHRERRIRRGAAEMLRALGAHGAGARVLLSLIQQDGIEQHMDFESRCTLLELFAEVTSPAEHRLSFEGIHLPQIPGKQLLVLVKRYLRVTSLLDRLSGGAEQGEEQQGSAVPSAVPEESSPVQQEFEFSMAMANLISELVHAMGWSHRHGAEPRPRPACSIFQHQGPAGPAVQKPVLPSNPGPQKKQGCAFLTASDFADSRDYVEYLQANLVRGMRVRLLEDCGDVRAGEEGEFLQSTSSMHMVQVLWQSTGQTHWMRWHILEIVDFGDQWEDPAQEKENSVRKSFNVDTAPRPFLRRPRGGLYSLPYLGQPLPGAAEALSRAEWWELLFFVRKLQAQEQQEIASLIQQHRGEQVDEEALPELSVPAELARKVLQALEQRCQGRSLRELRGSRVYARLFPARGPERGGAGSAAAPSEGGSGPEGAAAEAAEGERSAAPGPAQARGAAVRSDSQLFSELLEREGLLLPEASEEQGQALGSSEGPSEGGSLAEIAALLDGIQSSSSALGLRLAGLRRILKVLEEEPQWEQQVGTAQGGLGSGGAGEKLVQVAVELLSSEAAEKALVAVTLRLLAVLLLARREWRVPFATAGGVRAALARMRQHGRSALVQQAGLAALKVLLGAADAEAGGAGGTRSPWSRGDAQMMREIFASIGSASGEGCAGLLSSIPAALSAVQRVPGGSSAVQNGLLVVNALVDGHRGLAEQLASADLLAVLQSCWRAGPSGGCPRAGLALSALNRLAEHGLPPGPEAAAGREVPLDPEGVRELLGALGDGSLSKEVLVALERQLCGPGPVPSGQGAQLLRDRGCFQLLLRGLELLGSERAASLSILRILNKFLDSYEEDVLPWHECVEPCVSLLSSHSSSWEVLQEVVGFLHRLGSASKDCVVVMCHVGAHEALSRALEKHSTVPPPAPALLELLAECERYTGLYKELSSSVLAGCIQLVLGQIEEHRRRQQPICIPFFDVFLHNLCRGSSTEVKEDKCWEKVQVSSNPQQAGRLTDRNPRTYWESNGSSGSHCITVHLQAGVVIRELSMLVASEDSSYMPSRVVVLGGDSPATIRTELNAVSILPSDSRVVLLENMSRFWPVVQIRVKRCQQGGIDTRVRGIEVLGPKPTLWPLFREQLCRRTLLSCAARAHAWSQEIRRDRGQLLQLFGRLNGALQHEQAFASRFLPDAEAARALGRTFWEALVTPLVQSITSPGPAGVSALAWLLSEYLESEELPGRAAGRGAALGPSVRRLTRLLVHVDPGGAEAEQSRAAAGGKEGKNKEELARSAQAAVEQSSGLWGISQCWRGVVQQQVQRFLQAAGQAPDLAERYCRLYQRLRGATEELFGQQAAFVLALGQGFAGALLQLSFLAALHVSEQFARYLDVQIRELRGAAGSAGPPERLQRFLEPFVVFSGLELAHSFEHFYRLYLGDRLLAQGPSWLEGGVVEQLGLCFPSRFPQGILSDLAESEELQRQFRLFQLQERDRRLLETGTGPEEVLGTAPEGAEVAEVAVLALSPRCWPVSPLCYMENPARIFPAALSSPLEEFADFCRQSQSQPGWEGTKPCRLQWTWLGHAELQFGDCVLHVSTLQMCILLRFNSAQEVSVEALLQATGLPAELLHHALTPLTHGQGVLQGSCTAGGALRLNRAALAQGCGRRLRLLPRQRYLRTERAEVSALERKRNVLCCLIARILKAEKQLHVDSLVFRVIDACQKGELGPGVQFLSFCCHSVDVLSCILHLLHQGYVRRQEGRPQVLEYVCAEPTAPLGGQAQMTFQCRPAQESLEEDSRDSLHWQSPGTDRAEEYLMAMLQEPTGHTLSPEEAKLLMNQTVQQVQDTLSISDDVAQHLLMHCAGCPASSQPWNPLPGLCEPAVSH